ASIPQAPVQADYPLSSSQKRMWILSQFEDANLAYNVNGVYEFDSGFDQSAFELAYWDLIVRHESLRTVFRSNDQGDIRQLILDPDPDKFHVSYFDFQDRNEADESSQKIFEYITEAFDLYNGPLFKAGLFRLSPERLVLAYSMHHIISDGWSLQVMIRELLSLYHAHAT
ncbi:condensation domain-containing protein, partial [Chryseobacterium sp. JV558]|uniref:condensation domain-containing protein n=1 Tax=Chryseobacterium sp. JV558 TaxID=2663236 RepID=UPI00299E5ED7